MTDAEVARLIAEKQREAFERGAWWMCTWYASKDFGTGGMRDRSRIEAQARAEYLFPVVTVPREVQGPSGTTWTIFADNPGKGRLAARFPGYGSWTTNPYDFSTQLVQDLDVVSELRQHPTIQRAE